MTMSQEEMAKLHIIDSDAAIGKTIKRIVERSSNTDVLVVFTDGTFLVVDSDPEGEGCGLACDSWAYTTEEERREIQSYL